MTLQTKLLRGAAASLGQHTDEILAELGIEADRRRELREKGIV